MSVKVQKSEPFTIIPNEILNSNKISWKAKGILCYLLSKPNNWIGQFYNIKHAGKTNELGKTLEGEFLITNVFKELVKAGYAKRITKFNEDKSFNGSGYIVSNKKNEFDKPITNNL